MKSNFSEAESPDPTAQNLEASVSPGNLSGSSYGFNGSTPDVDVDYLSRDKEEVLRQLSDLKDQLEAKKLEVEGVSRQITELRGLLEVQSAKEEALNIVEELERHFGDEGHLAQVNKQLEVAQEEAQLRLSQLHHVQEELEHYYLLSRHQARLLAQLNKQLEVAQEEAQLRLSQLHHVQEELEHYYLLSRKQSTMLDASTKLQERAAVLLAGFRV